ncbi:hypothetical protein SCAR479_07742 [Seiridium cardinale]|uniref:Uncharacterized protein n=1 Tax=Seiridium cardinale TaxID=138064 RepID=A0ABR2XPA2_9PEZI
MSSRHHGFASCCAEGDFCHPDGLCYNLNGGQPTVRRQYCTDPTWGTTNCRPFCRHNADANSPSDGGAILTPCMDCKFCCGAFQYDCCYDHKGEYAIQGYQVGPGISYVSNSTTTQVVTSPSGGTPSTLGLATADTTLASATSSPTQNGSDTTGLNGGMIAGVVIGASLGVGTICITAALFFRKRSPSTPPSEQQFKGMWDTQNKPQNYAYSGNPHQELSSITSPEELPGVNLRHEMS